MNFCKKMAESGGGDGNPPKKIDSREEKLRVLRERQADERLRRLEDLKKHALEAQQLREQKEAERRKRMDELRVKDTERRSQVEGRKKQIYEAERERREAIVRKNQERDARMDAKRRNERSSIVFAFGSSTPRLLETSDSIISSYWGVRRATSTANLRLFPANSNTPATVNATPRRPSERDQETKKRASSAGGLYRNPSSNMTSSMYEVLHWSSHTPTPTPSPAPTSQLVPPPQTSPSSVIGASADGEDGLGVARVGRRKTDLMPTTPSPRDPNSRPGSGSRSLARTPGRAVSMARLDQLARPRSHLSRSTAQLDDQPPLRAAKSMVTLGRPQPAIVPRTTRAERLRQRARLANPSTSPVSSSGDVTPSRPGSVMSQSSILSASTLNPRLRSAPRRPRPSSIHVTGVSKDKILSPADDKPKPKENKVPPIKPIATKKQIQQKNEEIKKQQDGGKQNSTNSAAVEINGKDNVKKDNDHKVKKKEPVKAVVTETKDVDKKISIENGNDEGVKDKIKENKSVVKDENKQDKSKVNVEINEDKEKMVNLDIKEDNSLVNLNNKEDNSVVNVVKEMISNEIKASIDENNVKVMEVNQDGLLLDIGGSNSDVPNPILISNEAEVENKKAVVPNPLDIFDAPVVQPKSSDVILVPTTDSNQVVSSEPDSTSDSAKGNVMTRSRITTEEEAKAVLAERRRLAREQAEREAEAERQRLAKEAEEEEERIRKEEEEQRLFEEEQLRILEEARKMEEQRLMQAIQDAQKREEEEKERRRLEEQARLEKEEAEKQAREEAERQRLENVERLKKEEEERQARRKRVEDIMKRTRVNAPSNTNKEKGEEDGAEHEKDESKGNLEAFLHGERLSADRSMTNGKDSPSPILANINEESHPNNGLHSSGIPNEDCVNSNSPLDTPLIAFQGKTKDTPLPADFLA